MCRPDLPEYQTLTATEARRVLNACPEKDIAQGPPGDRPFSNLQHVVQYETNIVLRKWASAMPYAHGLVRGRSTFSAPAGPDTSPCPHRRAELRLQIRLRPFLQPVTRRLALAANRQQRTGPHGSISGRAGKYDVLKRYDYLVEAAGIEPDFALDRA
jgi:hypothetical protein